MERNRIMIVAFAAALATLLFVISTGRDRSSLPSSPKSHSALASSELRSIAYGGTADLETVYGEGEERVSVVRSDRVRDEEALVASSGSPSEGASSEGTPPMDLSEWTALVDESRKAFSRALRERSLELIESGLALVVTEDPGDLRFVPPDHGADQIYSRVNRDGVVYLLGLSRENSPDLFDERDSLDSLLEAGPKAKKEEIRQEWQALKESLDRRLMDADSTSR